MKYLSILVIFFLCINYSYGGFEFEDGKLNGNTQCDFYPSGSAGKSNWYFDDDLRCIDQMCQDNFHLFLKLFASDSANQNISVAPDTEDDTKVVLKIDSSVAECDNGQGGTECINDPCWRMHLYQSNTLLTEDNDTSNTTTNINSLEYTIDKTYYTNTTRCTLDQASGSNVYTCGVTLHFFFAGVEQKSQALATKSFNVVLTQLGAADKIVGTISTDTNILTLESSTSDLAEYIRDNPTEQPGTLTISNNGDINVGDQVDLVLTAPNTYHNRLFDLNKTIVITLAHSTDSTITLSPKATPAPANSAAEEGQNNTLTLSFDANVIGTYTLQVEATLTGEQKPNNTRILFELNSLAKSINSQTSLVVKSRDQQDFKLIFFLLSVCFCLTLTLLVQKLKDKKANITYKIQTDTEIEV